MKNKNIVVEICCESLPIARQAFEAGADRIELCRELQVGGVTPSHRDIEEAVRIAGEKAVHVLIRPRPGDFVYSPEEVLTMERDIAFCAEAGVNGVVIGALTPDGAVDISVCEALIAEARQGGLRVTFHRAIDEAADLFSALDDVIGLGAERALTSGGKPTAWEGRAAIAQMVRRAAGRTIIMPGSGVTRENALQIIEETGALEIHGSRISLMEGLSFT